MATTARDRSYERLPGISFETPVRVPDSTLPRMDVAAFVGFATGGPMNQPVPVEDVTRFRELFGRSDVRLAWDRRRGRPVRSLLGPAVEAFFRNGGARCWVVRVGDAATVHRHEFELSGLVRAVDLPLASIPSVRAPARSVGTWCESLRVATVLRREPATGAGASLQLDGVLSSQSLRVDLMSGELLELRFDGGLIHMFFVESVDDGLNGSRIVRLAGYWFVRQSTTPSVGDAGRRSRYGGARLDHRCGGHSDPRQ